MRIISLAPSVTEILFAIGLSQEIVGVTPYCDYPAEARAKPKVGYVHPTIESIAALRPDLVLATRRSMQPDVLGKLEQMKIPAYGLEAKTLEDILSHIQTLGRMLGRSGAADALAAEMRLRITEIKATTESLPRPRVLYVLKRKPLISVGPGSFIHQVIEVAGGVNAAPANSAYPRLTLDQMLTGDPEIIVVPAGAVEDASLWPGCTTVSAVRHGRIHPISGDLLNRPGPRIVQGLNALARILHPELVEGVRET